MEDDIGQPVSERGLFHFSKNSPVGARNRLDFKRNNSGGKGGEASIYAQKLFVKPNSSNWQTFGPRQGCRGRL